MTENAQKKVLTKVSVEPTVKHRIQELALRLKKFDYEVVALALRDFDKEGERPSILPPVSIDGLSIPAEYIALVAEFVDLLAGTDVSPMDKHMRKGIPDFLALRYDIRNSSK